MNRADIQQSPKNFIWIASAASPIALWLSQPPIGFWPLALVAIIPWIQLASDLAANRDSPSRRAYAIIWLLSAAYWLISLQGLRLAHPLMFIPWIVFAFYLAAYHLLFVIFLRRLQGRIVPLIVSIPVIWVALECVRNYLFTGISVLMLGHHVVNAPAMIQIADIFGSYGISFLLAMINVCIWMLVNSIRNRQITMPSIASWAVTVIATLSTLLYGQHRLSQPRGEELATFALIQRNEPIEYDLSIERANEIFTNYARQSIRAVREAEKPIDAVVWPESMFTGGQPWRFADQDAELPTGSTGSKSDLQTAVRYWQQDFVERANYVQSAIASAQPASPGPQLLVGCAVIHYSQEPNVYSGLINVGSDGTPIDWYGKTHLVMFGEYIPIAPYIPGLRSLIPPGMGLAVGPGAKRINVAETVVAPNICIETAVERIAVNQLESFDDDSIPNVVVTVTNGGWYDDSSVIDHHLVCAQLVAVGCRRPILSAANSGPTAWIDGNGTVVQRLETGTHGAVIATPQRDSRVSLYLRIGDWPARICVIALIGMLVGTRFKPSLLRATG